MRRVGALLALILLAPCATAAAQQATPIPAPLDGPLPRYEGAPTTARPLSGPFPKSNPALAPDGRSGSGLAASNGAASPMLGPLGRLPTRSSAVQPGSCSSLAFDAAGRLLTVCSGPAAPSLRLLDPVTLDTLSFLNLPPRRSQDMADAAGGANFMVRADGTLLVPTNNRTLITVAVEGDKLTQTSELSLDGLLAAGERPVTVAAGYGGRDWVAGNQGTIVTLPRGKGTPAALALEEPLSEDIATAPSGAYVVTHKALYRLRADATGKPSVVWRQVIEAGVPDTKAGRLHPGSGTPPAMVGGATLKGPGPLRVGAAYVAVADGLDPPRLMVLRIQGGAARRVHCAVPLFRRGHGSVEAHLVVAGSRIVAANAYGYENPSTTEGGRTTTGGIAQIAVGKRGCRRVWTSDEITPSAQAVVSRATGLLYTVDKPAGFPDRWNLAALDWRTGKQHFRVLAGEGLGFNSNGGAVALGPDGAAYAASYGGVSRFKDIDG